MLPLAGFTAGGDLSPRPEGVVEHGRIAALPRAVKKRG
jgi:hypothetical protein